MDGVEKYYADSLGPGALADRLGVRWLHPRRVKQRVGPGNSACLQTFPGSVVTNTRDETCDQTEMHRGERGSCLVGGGQGSYRELVRGMASQQAFIKHGRGKGKQPLLEKTLNF